MIQNITLISIGVFLNVLTFSLGVAVGVTLCFRRKDSSHDRDSYRDPVASAHGDPSQN